MDDMNKMIDPDDKYPEGDPPGESSVISMEEPEPVEPEPVPDLEPVVEPTEPAEGDPAPGDGDEIPNPYDQQFQDEGLNNQFKSVDDMMKRVPYLNQYTTRMAQENADLKRQIEEANKPPVDSTVKPDDEFWTDPTKQLDNRYLTTEAAQTLVAQMQTQEAKMLQMQVDTFASKHQDFEELRTLMHEIGQADPGYYNLKNPLDSLHREARRIMDTRKAPITNVAQVRADQSLSKDKQKATTTGTGNKPQSRNVTPDDLYDMPLDELGAMMGRTTD